MKQTLPGRYRKDLSYDHDAERLGIPSVCLVLFMGGNCFKESELASNEMRERVFYSLAVIASMTHICAIETAAC
jgi:hypothetical protein